MKSTLTKEKKDDLEVALEEIDEPIYCDGNPARYESSSVSYDNSLETKSYKVRKDFFTTMKGHNLLGWCIFLLFTIYILEKIFPGRGSGVAEKIIEILKLLTFSLTGYLFGKQTEDL